MTINLAALQDAAEALAEGARARDEGRDADAVFALTRSSLASITAFGPDTTEVLFWSLLVDAIDPPAHEIPDAGEDDEPEVAL